MQESLSSPVFWAVILATMAFVIAVSATLRVSAVSIALAVAVFARFALAAPDAYYGALAAAALGVGVVQAFSSTLFGSRDESDTTILDGLQFRVDGTSGYALGRMLGAVVVGTLAGLVGLLLVTLFARDIALRLSFLGIAVWSLAGLVVVSSAYRKLTFRGMVAGGAGLSLGVVGFFPGTSETRFTFGQDALWDGLPPVLVGVGVLVLGDLFLNVWRRTVTVTPPGMGMDDVWLGVTKAVRPWQWDRDDPGISVALRQTAFIALLGFAAVAILPSLLINLFPVGPVASFAGFPARELGISVGVVSIVVVALGMGGCFLIAGSSQRLADVARSRPAVVMSVAVLLPSVSLPALSSDVELSFWLIAAGALGATMNAAGWPRLPLVIGLSLSGLVSENLAAASFFYSVPEMFTQPPVLLAGLFVAVSVPLYRWYVKATSARSTQEGTEPEWPAPSGGVSTAVRSSRATHVVTIVMLLIALGVWVGSFAYDDMAFYRIAATGVLVALAIQVRRDRRDGLWTRRVLVGSPLALERAQVRFLAVIAVCLVLAWLTDIRWAALAFAALTPVLLVEGPRRFLLAGVSVVLVYLCVLACEEIFFAIWF